MDILLLLPFTIAMVKFPKFELFKNRTIILECQSEGCERQPVYIYRKGKVKFNYCTYHAYKEGFCNFCGEYYGDTKEYEDGAGCDRCMQEINALQEDMK